MWRKLSSKVLIDHRFLVVEEDEVELPTGRRIQWLRYGYPGNGVVIAALNDNDEVRFLKEYSYVQQKLMLQLPMGGINPKETPEQCASRELQEEGEIAARKLKLAGTYLQNHRRSGITIHVFLATDLFESSLPQDEDEIIQSLWIPRTRITELINQGEIVDSDTLCALRICGL